MHNIAEFLQKNNHWFLFVILELVAVVLLFQFNRYQGSVWFTSANAVSAQVYDVTSAVEQYFSLKDQNSGLTARNIALERENAVLREKLIEAGSDSTVLATVRNSVPATVDVIPGHVISNTIDREDNLMTIDVGESDGVRPNMGVVSGTGLVGIVFQTSAHYSIVIPILSSRSSISCGIQDRGYFGYLKWQKGSPRTAFLENVPRHAKFKLYDKVVTSGYSAVFPQGIYIGKVMHVRNSADGLSYSVEVELGTDFSRVRDICVINDNSAQERLQLMRAAEDSTKVSKDNTH